MDTITLGNRPVGNGYPVFFIAEIGINHNGSMETAKKLIDLAVMAGCDAVKFQKRTPELCVPVHQRHKMRETPWGYISYMEYRTKIEFGRKEYDEIDRYCKNKGIMWFASCWDKPSVDFIRAYDTPCYKIASASLTDTALLRYHRATQKPLILSTGMSTQQEIDAAVKLLGTDNTIVPHSTTTYPSPPQELNLPLTKTLQPSYDCPIGYSGHEEGLPSTVAAVALGACVIERHITLDRAMWGSDQAASIAPIGLIRLLNHIRSVEQAMGDGCKKVYESEKPIMKKLRACAAQSDTGEVHLHAT